MRVYYKYILDIAFGALAVASVGTPLAPVVIFATAAYLFVDLYTNGFGFDYSVPEPIFFPD